MAAEPVIPDDEKITIKYSSGHLTFGTLHEALYANDMSADFRQHIKSLHADGSEEKSFLELMKHDLRISMGDKVALSIFVPTNNNTSSIDVYFTTHMQKFENEDEVRTYFANNDVKPTAMIYHDERVDEYRFVMIKIG